MGHKTLIGGTAYDIKGGRTLIGGTGYDIKKGRTLIGGTAYDISFGTPLGELAAKTSVYMNVNGVRTEWKVAHQGNPDTAIYDASCNGTWVVMKNIYSTISNLGSNNVYSESNAHSYLNNTFLGLLDTDIQAVIKQAKIPYTYDGSSEAVKTLANGLSAKVFLLSGVECGGTKSNYMHAEGAALDCFTSNDDRIAYLNGVATEWATRSPYVRGTAYYWYVNASGQFAQWFSYAAEPGIRPALIFDSEKAFVDSEFNIIVA